LASVESLRPVVSYRRGPGSHRGDCRLCDSPRPGSDPSLAGAILALVAIWLLALRKGIVAAIIGAGVLGIVAAVAGVPIKS
jgi:hypothetical protein